MHVGVGALLTAPHAARPFMSCLTVGPRMCTRGIWWRSHWAGPRLRSICPDTVTRRGADRDYGPIRNAEAVAVVLDALAVPATAGRRHVPWRPDHDSPLPQRALTWSVGRYWLMSPRYTQRRAEADRITTQYHRSVQRATDVQRPRADGAGGVDDSAAAKSSCGAPGGYSQQSTAIRRHLDVALRPAGAARAACVGRAVG